MSCFLSPFSRGDGYIPLSQVDVDSRMERDEGNVCIEIERQSESLAVCPPLSNDEIRYLIGFVDDSSLLRLRQVSKKYQRVVDEYLLSEPYHHERLSRKFSKLEIANRVVQEEYGGGLTFKDFLLDSKNPYSTFCVLWLSALTLLSLGPIFLGEEYFKELADESVCNDLVRFLLDAVNNMTDEMYANSTGNTLPRPLNHHQEFFAQLSRVSSLNNGASYPEIFGLPAGFYQTKNVTDCPGLDIGIDSGKFSDVRLKIMTPLILMAAGGFASYVFNLIEELGFQSNHLTIEQQVATRFASNEVKRMQSLMFSLPRRIEEEASQLEERIATHPKTALTVRIFRVFARAIFFTAVLGLTYKLFTDHADESLYIYHPEQLNDLKKLFSLNDTESMLSIVSQSMSGFTVSDSILEYFHEAFSSFSMNYKGGTSGLLTCAGLWYTMFYLIPETIRATIKLIMINDVRKKILGNG